MPSNHLSLCCPLLSCPQSFLASRSFPVSQLCIRWLMYWSFSFSIHPSSEYSRLISFRIDRLYRFAVQWILKSLLQHSNSKASVLWHSAFFMVQLSHPCITTGAGRENSCQLKHVTVSESLWLSLDFLNLQLRRSTIKEDQLSLIPTSCHPKPCMLLI